MKKSLAAALLVAFGTVLSACTPAGTSGAMTPSPSPDLHALAAEYVAVADRGNNAMAQLSVEFNGDSTVAQYNATAKKAAAVYHDVDAQLMKLRFPDNMQNDVKNLLKADSTIEAIFISMSTDTSSAAIQADIDRLATAGPAKLAAADAVRHDLGLPPATASTA
jgi:hypothetical protein